MDLLGGVTFAELADSSVVTRAICRGVHSVVGSPAVADMVIQLSDSIYALAASDDFTLGDVIPRDKVEALMDKVLSMEATHVYLLERASQSPLLSQAVANLVGRIVTDFLDQSRKTAERIPGMGLALSLGGKAASAAKGVAGGALEDMAGKGAQATLRRTNKATVELLLDPLTKAALMEFWDMHAADTIGMLRNYVSAEDATEVTGLIHDLLVNIKSDDYVDAVIKEGVEVFFARYGQWDLASMIAELGIDRDKLVEDVRDLAGPLLSAARANGSLAAQARRRLEPFYNSALVARILG
jgi:hypothetical protein